MIENKKLSLVGWTFFAGLLAAVIIGVIFYWYYPGNKQVNEYIPLTLYENGEYVHYTLQGKQVERAPLATSTGPMVVTYPNGDGLTVTETGLVWLPAASGTPVVLIERANLSMDSWSIAADGSHAVLFNPETRSYDVFEVLYQGATVSYIGTFPRPVAPTYTVSVGFAGPSKVVLRTGAPQAFEVYKIKDDSLKQAFTAVLKTIPVTK